MCNKRLENIRTVIGSSPRTMASWKGGVVNQVVMQKLSTVTSIVLRTFRIELDGIRVVHISNGSISNQLISVPFHIQLFLGFLLQSILGDSLESLLNVDSLLGRCLEVRNVALRLTPRHGTFLRNLKDNSAQNTQGWQPLTWRFPSSTSILFPSTTNGKFSGS